MDGPLLSVVQQIADVPEPRALELIALGAVYLGETIKGQGDKIKWRRAIQLAAAAGTAAGAGESITGPCRAVGLQVRRGEPVRVHPRPKRFPACATPDWQQRLLYIDDDYVVINKPSNLPSMSHESNGLEHAAACAAAALGTGPLSIGHRLDLWTTGVLVLCRSKVATAAFMGALQGRSEAANSAGSSGASAIGNSSAANARISQTGAASERGPPAAADRSAAGSNAAGDAAGSRDVSTSGRVNTGSSNSATGGIVKVYKALTRSRVPLGVLEHYMYDGPLGDGLVVMRGGSLATRPRLLAVDACEGAATSGMWKVCLLDVMDCRQVAAGDLGAVSWLRESFGTDQRVSGSSNILSIDGSSAPFVDSAAASSDEAGNMMYEVTVRLITGRSHQIRAQLAAIGAPLVGDSLYGPLAGYLVGGSGVVSEKHKASIDACQQLDGPIGLHAWWLEWGGRCIKAPVPWHAPDQHAG